LFLSLTRSPVFVCNVVAMLALPFLEAASVAGRHSPVLGAVSHVLGLFLAVSSVFVVAVLNKKYYSRYKVWIFVITLFFLLAFAALLASSTAFAVMGDDAPIPTFLQWAMPATATTEIVTLILFGILADRFVRFVFHEEP
jgi:hypothetical protein